MYQRILDIRDQSRFVPEKALTQLQALQAKAEQEPPATRAELINQLSVAHLRTGQLDAAMADTEQLISFGRAQHDDAMLAKGLLAKSYVLFEKAEASAAYQLAFEAEKLANKSSDLALRSQAQVTVGQAYAEQGDFPTALSKIQQALDTAREATSDPVMLFGALNALTKLYTQMKEYDKADLTLQEMLELAGQLHSPGRMAAAKTTEYVLAVEIGQYKRAIQAQQLALDLMRKLGSERGVGMALGNLSDAYLKLHDYARAAQYANESLRSTQKSGDRSMESTARANLAQAYLAMGRIAEGKQQYEQALSRYEQENNKPLLQAILREYGEALERVGDTAGAVSAYHRERTISDQLFERRRQQAVLELQEKYETEKKQRQIELLSRDNQLKGTELDNKRLQQRVWWLLALVTALGALIVGMLYRRVRHANAQLEVKNLELKAQSVRDPLTALYNRRHFQDFMRALPHGDARESDLVGALFLLDVDHFKHINDSYGHAAGDAVLKMLAEHLRVALRETDMIVRWGGEEFLAYLPAVSRHGIDDVARRILRSIAAQKVEYQGHSITVQVSVGYAPYPLAPDGTPLPWERVVNLVDMALYLAKAHGRHRAYGLRGFANFEHTTLEAIEQDLERAWRAGFVDLSVVLGDAPDAVPPSPNEANNVVHIKHAHKNSHGT
ncbi:diguanylate cyclase [Pseudoduganella sp. FT93W]|uniref:diguanylate cyclase n=2 Tax=Duganella fentianensis TaxID=2692177 RepID=A0A845HSV3_9BURK|nr:diguanylate cyclase [Duganella fentianensis]